MKIIKISLVFLILGLVSCSNNSDLKRKKIYEINSQSLNIIPTIITEKTEHQLSLNPFKIYIRVLVNNLTDVVILSQDTYYSFSGDIELLEQLEGRNRSYTFSLNGYGRTYFNFLLDTKTKKVSTYSNSILSKIDATYKQSSLSIDDFTEMFKKGRENEFYPLKMMGRVGGYEIEDYWLSYFGIDYVVEERVEKRNEELREKQEVELLEKQKRETSESLKQRENQLCSLIENYDTRNLLKYGATSEDLNIIMRGDNIIKSRSEKNSERKIADLPKSKVEYGFIDKDGVILDENGNSYIGPFMLTYLDEIILGNWKYGVYDHQLRKNVDNLENLRDYLVKCSSIESHMKKYRNY